MYETLIGVLFAAGSVSSYLLAAKIVGRMSRWPYQLRRGHCARRRGAVGALTTDELSGRFSPKR